MKLAVFDIDGTLTQSSEVDSHCFKKALNIEFGINELDRDWQDYAHATDSCIFEEIFLNHFSRIPTLDELNRIKKRYLSFLSEAFDSDPTQFQAVPGAREFLDL